MKVYETKTGSGDKQNGIARRRKNLDACNVGCTKKWTACVMHGSESPDGGE